MSDIDELRDEVVALRGRLARLEAKEACLSTLNQYLYLMDVGYPEELLHAVFTPDAVLEVVNFPPGTMQDLRFVGHDEIRPLYVQHTVTAPAIQGGHHTANVAVDVAPDLQRATLSAYFMTSGNGATLQGGMYQGELVPVGGGEWRFARYRILSGWGWRVAKEANTRITENLPAARAFREGRPAAYSPVSS